MEGFVIQQGRHCNQHFFRRDARPMLLDIRWQERQSPLVIFIHGFKGYKDWGAWSILCEALFRAGCHVISFNFSHNGGTLEEPIDFPDLEAFAQNTYSKEQKDIQDVMDMVFAQAPDDISVCTLLGHSRGGAMATIYAAQDQRVDSLITMAAVADLESRFQAYEIPAWQREGRLYIPNGRTGQQMPMNYEFYTDFIENRDKLDVQAAAARFGGRSLFIHAADDPVVDVSEARRLNKASKNAELFILPSGGHTFGMRQPWSESDLPLEAEQALARIKAFLQIQTS